jgi:hypothetical protein
LEAGLISQIPQLRADLGTLVSPDDASIQPVIR